MWIFGAFVLLLASACVSVLLGWRPGRAPPQIWDLPGTARTYTTIVGTLAGFSVTSSISIANLSVARQSANFEGVMALFLVAFVVFASSAMQFGTTPNLTTRRDSFYLAVQGYSYLLANASFYLGLCLSWLGLPLLLAAIGLDYLSDIFIWLVLFAILGGAMRVSSSGLNLFATMKLSSSLGLPLLCFGAAAIYYAVAEAAFDAFLPDERGPVMYAVVCFAVAAIGLSMQSAFVGSLRNESSASSIQFLGRRFLIGFIGSVFTAVSLLWLAVMSEL
jgi:hypothetical protein